MAVDGESDLRGGQVDEHTDNVASLERGLGADSPRLAGCEENKT